MKHTIYFVFAIVIALASSLPVSILSAGAGSTFSCADVMDIPLIECEALVAFYDNTKGPAWTRSEYWLAGDTAGAWYGVTVASGHVTRIELENNNLSGFLPLEMGNLTNLVVLDLFINQVTGSFPMEFANLTSLEVLNLDANELSGSLPPFLADLTSLTYLDLSRNQLSGSIPPEFGDLASLENLELFGNQLSGSIPPELGQLTTLKVLSLCVNQLSGSIPVELINLSNLHELDLCANQLSGGIPPGLGSLTSLVLLDLSDNLLTGGIPIELVNIYSLGFLSLAENQLTGTIPSELGELINLGYLWLSDNQLTGSIPIELGYLPMVSLQLDSNQLSGNIPSELGYLTGLFILYLQDNQLEGDIPSTFINLHNLFNYGELYGIDGLRLDYNRLNVPPGYPDPDNPLHAFVQQKDPYWQLYQGFTQIIGNGGGELSSLDGRTNFLIPEGALITDTTFTFVPQPAPHHNSGWQSFAKNSFTLTAHDAMGDPVTTFNLPVTVTLSYTNTDIIGPEDSIVLYYWDGIASAWADAVTTCLGGEYMRDPAGNLLTLPLCHLTEFGVFSTPLRTFLPVIHR